MLWIALATLVLTAVPSLWWARRSFEEAHLEDELSELARAHAAAVASLDERLSSAELSVSRLASLLEDQALHADPTDEAVFDALVTLGPDGKRRSDPSRFDGTQEAGIVLERGATLDASGKVLYVGAKRLLDHYGVQGLMGVEGLWLILDQGGLMLCPRHPDFIYDVPLGTSYAGTEWVTLTLPDQNPDGEPRWTAATRAPVRGDWIVSVVAPLREDGRWSGVVGHDLFVDGLCRLLGPTLDRVQRDTLLARSDGTLLFSERHADRVMSEGGVRLGDLGDPLMAEVLDRLGDQASVNLRDDAAGRSLVVDRVGDRGWLRVTEIDHDAVLEDLRAHYGEFWSWIVALLVVIALLPVFVVGRLVRISVRGLVAGSRQVSQGNLGFRFPAEGPREIRTIADAINAMIGKLTESEQRTRAVLETMADGVLTVDGRARIVSCNRAMATMLGRVASDIVGERVSKLGPAFESVEELLASGEDTSSWTFDSIPEATHADGGDFPVEVKARLTVGGESSLVTLTVRDLTRRRDAERKHRALEAQLRQAQKMEAVGQLAGGVAHDFNNLLTGIMGYAEALRTDQQPGTEAYDDATQIVRAAERAAGLTRQLLLFSRRQELRPVAVPINELLSSLTPMLRRLIPEGVELRLDLGQGIGTVHVDPGCMEQVAMNLVVNASDAMPAGGTITISTCERRLDSEAGARLGALPAGDYVTVTVRDTGTGIAPEVMPNIFEPFFTTKGPGEGTGLGLSTVFGIVQESSGYVEVESAPGKGSEFTVFLPAHGAAAASGFIPSVVESPTGGETILVVEDEDTVRRLLLRVLSDRGYRVIVAGDGEQALELLDAEPRVDLLLSDIVMPGMSGPELAEEVTARRPGLPVLFMSGYSADALRRLGLSDAGLDLMPKPFGLSDLAHRIREAIDRSAASV